MRADALLSCPNCEECTETRWAVSQPDPAALVFACDCGWKYRVPLNRAHDAQAVIDAQFAQEPVPPAETVIDAQPPGPLPSGTYEGARIENVEVEDGQLRVHLDLSRVRRVK